MVLLRALALGSMFYAAGGNAQLTANISVVSDYRFRGVSLSQQKPAAQATIGYDDPRGWYGGLFGSTVGIAAGSATTGQAMAYLGIATPIRVGLHWEAGADYSTFVNRRDYDYGEVYTGITSTRFNARLHYSPHYFGAGAGSFYLEANGTHRIDERFVLLAHVGILVPVGHRGDQYADAVRTPIDARAGVALAIAGFDVQLALVAAHGTGSVYPVDDAQRRTTVVASVSRSF